MDSGLEPRPESELPDFRMYLGSAEEEDTVDEEVVEESVEEGEARQKRETDGWEVSRCRARECRDMSEGRRCNEGYGRLR